MEGLKNHKVHEWFKIVVPIAGPVIFEILNECTGDWTNEVGRLHITAWKWIVILIGIVYLAYMIYIGVSEHKNTVSIESLKTKIETANSKIKAYEKCLNSISNLMAYTGDKIKEQTEYFKSSKKIDVRNININTASTTICQIIYENITNNGNKTNITVNMYEKTKENGIEYSTMIAHEGHASNPAAFGQRKMLRRNKHTRYCDKILLNNKPDYIVFLSREKIAEAFEIKIEDCKYYQYLAIPIRKKGGYNIALIEIVVHDDKKIWESEEEAVNFASSFCEAYQEYVLLINRLYEQGTIIANEMDREVVENERQRYYINKT